MEDAQLLDRLLAGDERAFTQLVTRYHPTLVRVATYYVADTATAEDVAQDTWVAVLRGIDRFEGRSSFKTWLLRICANRARTKGVRERRSVSYDPTADVHTVDPGRFDARGAWTDPPVPFADELADRAEQSALAILVRAAITELGEPYRTAVTLRDVEGLSTMEVAELLALRESHVRVIVHRGRATLRARLEATIRDRQ